MIIYCKRGCKLSNSKEVIRMNPFSVKDNIITFKCPLCSSLFEYELEKGFYICNVCKGLGRFIYERDHSKFCFTCTKCGGQGFLSWIDLVKRGLNENMENK